MISILIPTFNRTKILTQTLDYYEKQKFEGEILIGDSSDEIVFQKLNDNIKHLSLDIKTYHTPHLNNYATTNYIIDKSKYDFCIWSPDDDLIYIPALKKAINFLKSNSDFCTVWGITMMYKHFKENNSFKSYYINFQTSKSIVSNNPILRLRDHYNFYTSVFIGVSRKRALKKALSGTNKVSITKSKSVELWHMSQQLSELFVSSSLVLQGKIKSLNSLYWIRNIHDERYVFSNIENIFFDKKTIDTFLFFEKKLITILNNDYDIISNNNEIRGLVFRFIFRKRLNEKSSIINIFYYLFFSLRYFFARLQFKQIQKYI